MEGQALKQENTINGSIGSWIGSLDEAETKKNLEHPPTGIQVAWNMHVGCTTCFPIHGYALVTNGVG